MFSWVKSVNCSEVKDIDNRIESLPGRLQELSTVFLSQEWQSPSSKLAKEKVTVTSSDKCDKAMIVSEVSFQISKTCQIFCDQHVMLKFVSPYRNFLRNKNHKTEIYPSIPSESIRKPSHLHIFPGKAKFRTLRTQLFGVVRHAERADGVFAWWEGGRWSSSEDGRRPKQKKWISGWIQIFVIFIPIWGRFPFWYMEVSKNMDVSKNRGKTTPPKWMVNYNGLNPIF